MRVRGILPRGVGVGGGGGGEGREELGGEVRLEEGRDRAEIEAAHVLRPLGGHAADDVGATLARSGSNSAGCAASSFSTSARRSGSLAKLGKRNLGDGTGRSSWRGSAEGGEAAT